MNLKDIQLKRLEKSDYFKLKPYFANQVYPLCAYSLESMIVWDTEAFHPYYTILDDALIIAFNYTGDKKENSHLLLPIANGRYFSPEQLAQIAETLGFGAYWFVPETYIEQIGKSQVASVFSIQIQSQFEDYIYRTEDLAGLKGNKYSKKRNLINQFKRNYLFNGNVKVQPITQQDVVDCIDFLEKWCEERACSMEINDDLNCEKEAAINALQHIEELDLKGILLRLNGDVSAFAISAPLTNEMGTLMFEKAFANVKGLYQYFDNQCAKMLFNGYQFINKESDMNIPGLAKSKRSYHPIKMMPAYRFNLR